MVAHTRRGALLAADPRSASYCQHYDPDESPPETYHDLEAPCFSGRVTHLENVDAADAFVAVNYQSKAVLVMQDAEIDRLSCDQWLPTYDAPPLPAPKKKRIGEEI